MKKLLAMMFVAIATMVLNNTAIAQTKSVFGVSLEMPASDFTTELTAKANDIVGMAKAKKCKIEVNKYVPGNPSAVCCVEISLDYKATESETAYAMLRSVFNSKYGENKVRLVRLPIPKDGLFWKTSFGEIALYKISDTIGIRIFNYDAIASSYNELTKSL